MNIEDLFNLGESSKPNYPSDSSFENVEKGSISKHFGLKSEQRKLELMDKTVEEVGIEMGKIIFDTDNAVDHWTDVMQRIIETECENDEEANFIRFYFGGILKLFSYKKHGENQDLEWLHASFHLIKKYL